MYQRDLNVLKTFMQTSAPVLTNHLVMGWAGLRVWKLATSNLLLSRSGAACADGSSQRLVLPSSISRNCSHESLTAIYSERCHGSSHELSFRKARAAESHLFAPQGHCPTRTNGELPTPSCIRKGRSHCLKPSWSLDVPVAQCMERGRRLPVVLSCFSRCDGTSAFRRVPKVWSSYRRSDGKSCLGWQVMRSG